MNKLNKKINIVLTLILTAGTVVSVFFSEPVFSQTCPLNTQVGETTATLVGEVTDDGGDPSLEVWFQYGASSSLGNETSKQFKSGLGLFCATITGLTPGVTYHYRAVTRNSAGTSFGEIRNFTTRSAPVSVDILANSAQGPITLSHNSFVNLSWTSSNASACTASGDWSGSKTTSGSQSIQLTRLGTFNFTITCTDSSGSKTSTDSVQVNVVARLPVVITKPAVVTF